jgi:hydrogenase nickel incorporation protein HypB
MCDVCGCGDPAIVSEEIHERILSDNDRMASHNREHFERCGVLALNLMGSPGSGKTALLEATRRAAPELRLGAVSGDLATENDAERLSRAGIPARTITTGSACHLDASMVHHALHPLGDDPPDVFFIENVANVVALSVTEGPDKPLKYPVMFRAADLVLLTKADLLPHLPDVEPERIREALTRVMPAPRMLVVSASTGEGIEDWVAWIGALRARGVVRQRDATGDAPAVAASR